MKRLIFLIFAILICIIGFLFARGIFSLASISGLESTLSFLFNSRFSEILALSFIGLLAVILYRQELKRIIRMIYIKMAYKPVYQKSYTGPLLVRKVAMAEQKMADTEQALNNFSQAIEKYALHLSSHTGAIQGLNAASHELHKGAAAQNRVLMHFMENMDKPIKTPRTAHWRIDPPPVKTEKSGFPPEEPKPLVHPDIPTIEKQPIPPGCARNPRRKIEKHVIVKPDVINHQSPEPPPEIVIDSESLLNVQKTVNEIRAKQGKTRIRQNMAAEALAAEEEILKAIRNLNAQLDESETQE